MTSFYSRKELERIGFKSIGVSEVLVSRKASIYGAENISLGSHVRIDDFCILSGEIKLGNFIHISAYSALFGGRCGIEMEDFTTVSSRCAIYAISDDYSGDALANPTVDDEFRNVIFGKVTLRKHAIIGSGCTILPNVDIGEGCSVGSMSLVTKSLAPWGIYVGIPCKKLKDRNRKLLELEKQFREKTEILPFDI